MRSLTLRFNYQYSMSWLWQ